MTHHVDAHVGKCIRHRRWFSGLTQQQLAEMVGVKFQQIQKYETGANRVSASRLWAIADSLGVPVSFFFEGLPSSYRTKPTLAADVERDKAHRHNVASDLIGNAEAMDLVRTYYTIPETQRRRLFELAQVLSDAA
ncbi:MAG: helix-turn-helix domain-containing protein [Rhodobacterales bacterium]